MTTKWKLKGWLGVWLLSGRWCTLYRWGGVRFAWRADVLGVYVCLGGVTWSVKGSQGTIKRAFGVEPAVLWRILIQRCFKTRLET